MSKIEVVIIIKRHRHRHLDLICLEFDVSFSYLEHEIHVYAVFISLEINQTHLLAKKVKSQTM
jgi:hypothetical protein